MLKTEVKPRGTVGIVASWHRGIVAACYHKSGFIITFMAGRLKRIFVVIDRQFCCMWNCLWDAIRRRTSPPV